MWINLCGFLVTCHLSGYVNVNSINNTRTFKKVFHIIRISSLITAQQYGTALRELKQDLIIQSDYVFRFYEWQDPLIVQQIFLCDIFPSFYCCERETLWIKTCAARYLISGKKFSNAHQDECLNKFSIYKKKVILEFEGTNNCGTFWTFHLCKVLCPSLNSA